MTQTKVTIVSTADLAGEVREVVRVEGHLDVQIRSIVEGRPHQPTV